jgi:hypothetical protein
MHLLQGSIENKIKRKKDQEDSFEINSTSMVGIKKILSEIIEKNIDLFFNFDLITVMVISKKHRQNLKNYNIN